MTKKKPDYEERVHIPISPDDLAFMVVNTPPKKEEDWEYLKEKERDK